MNDSLVDRAWKDLESTTCYCGNAKEKKMSFCRRCYFALPMRLRKDLYKPMSEGYATIYDEAKDFLRIEADIQPGSIAKGT